MPLPSNASDWQSLWADLFRGVGAGLLELDGSRAAQAALAGLEVFDATRERRRIAEEQRRQVSDERDDARSHQVADTETHMEPPLSDVERAHFNALSPEERQAWLEEMAEADRQNDFLLDRWRSKPHGTRPVSGHPGLVLVNSTLPARRRPMSASPFDGWSMGSVLPFGAGGQLNFPTFRR